MKVFVVIALCMYVAVVSTASEKDKAGDSSASTAEGEIKIYKRLIPADVLRGKCYI